MIQIVVIIAYLIYCMMVCLFPADRMNISKYWPGTVKAICLASCQNPQSLSYGLLLALHAVLYWPLVESSLCDSTVVYALYSTPNTSLYKATLSSIIFIENT